ARGDRGAGGCAPDPDRSGAPRVADRALSPREHDAAELREPRRVLLRLPRRPARRPLREGGGDRSERRGRRHDPPPRRVRRRHPRDLRPDGALPVRGGPAQALPLARRGGAHERRAQGRRLDRERVVGRADRRHGRRHCLERTSRGRRPVRNVLHFAILLALLATAPLQAAVNYDAGVLTLEGVQVFQDADDPTAWYYLPQYPRVARNEQG